MPNDDDNFTTDMVNDQIAANQEMQQRNEGQNLNNLLSATRNAFPAPITNLSNRAGFNLYFEHVPTGKKVAFPAFVTSHTDAYTSNWNEQTVFGRMDPIATFESTKRVSAMGFKVVAYSLSQAASNLNKINRLISFLYPTYTERSSKIGTTVNMGPLVRIKYGNQITNVDNNKGLLGYITTGITVTPDLEAGVFAASGQPSQTVTGVSGQEYLYKAYELNFELTVLHEHSLGFVERNLARRGNKKVYAFRSNRGSFPYNSGKFNTQYGVKSKSIKPVRYISDLTEEDIPSEDDVEGRIKLLGEIQEGRFTGDIPENILNLTRSGDADGILDAADLEDDDYVSTTGAQAPEGYDEE